MAAAVLDYQLVAAGLADVVTVESAGTGGWHVGDRADDRALRTLKEHGYDGSAHRARQFDAGWFDNFDLVLALDQRNLADLTAMSSRPDDLTKIRLLRSFEPRPTRSDEAAESANLDVPDPYFGDLDGYEHALALIEEAIPGVIAEMRASLADSSR